MNNSNIRVLTLKQPEWKRAQQATKIWNILLVYLQLHLLNELWHYFAGREPFKVDFLLNAEPVVLWQEVAARSTNHNKRHPGAGGEGGLRRLLSRVSLASTLPVATLALSLSLLASLLTSRLDVQNHCRSVIRLRYEATEQQVNALTFWPADTAGDV